jgi:serine/threonine protein kinase
VSELSGYAFSPLREGDFPLYRGSGESLAPVLLVTAEETSLAGLKRLEHEYSLRAELDVAWAAQPVALSRYRGHLTLVLEDPGGEPLDRRLGRPLEVSEFLRIAIPLAGALRQVHARGLIHRDIKPARPISACVSRPGSQARASDLKRAQAPLAHRALPYSSSSESLFEKRLSLTYN